MGASSVLGHTVLVGQVAVSITEAWSCSCSSNSTVTLGLYRDKLLQAVHWGVQLLSGHRQGVFGARTSPLPPHRAAC